MMAVIVEDGDAVPLARAREPPLDAAKALESLADLARGVTPSS
jgi:hypothetical protein